MKLTKQQETKIEISFNLSAIGYALNSLINERHKFPSLFTNNGSLRKGSLETFRNHRLKLKSV